MRENTQSHSDQNTKNCTKPRKFDLSKHFNEICVGFPNNPYRCSHPDMPARKITFMLHNKQLKVGVVRKLERNQSTHQITFLSASSPQPKSSWLDLPKATFAHFSCTSTHPNLTQFIPKLPWNALLNFFLLYLSSWKGCSLLEIHVKVEGAADARVGDHRGEYLRTVDLLALQRADRYTRPPPFLAN